MIFVTALEIAREIYKDCSHFSMTGRCKKHARWPELKALGDAALPDLFVLLQEEFSSAHVMTMIANVASEQVFIPESEQGRVKAMGARFMTWGRYKGYVK